MPGDIEALYYLAYQDMIEEEKREEEKKKKAEEEKRKAEKESKIVELMKKKGVHLPAKILAAQQRREQLAKQKAQEASNGSIPSLDLNALLDELEE